MKHLCIAVLAVSVGCSKKLSSPDAMKKTAEIREAHRESLKARCLPAYTALQRPAPVSEDKVTGVAALDHKNAGALTEAWAATMEFATVKDSKQRDVPGRFVLDDLVAPSSTTFADMCAWLIKEKSPAASQSPDHSGIGSVPNEQVVANVTEAMTRFEAIKFVVAVRVVEHVPPKLTEGGFEPGTIKGEARVFDDKGADHGGFHFQATNSSKVDYRADVSRKTGETKYDDKDSSVAQDLARNAKAAFTAALAKAVPGSSLTL